MQTDCFRHVSWLPTVEFPTLPTCMEVEENALRGASGRFSRRPKSSLPRARFPESCGAKAELEQSGARSTPGVSVEELLNSASLEERRPG